MSETAFTVKSFDPERDSPAEIAALHLQVRQGQVRDDNNVLLIFMSHK
jgi:hypothetical protein